MILRMLIITLMFVPWPTIARVQDKEFFRSKLGKPSELYRHKSGISVSVVYDEEGQVCSIGIVDPSHQRGTLGSFPRLVAVADELIPLTNRGRMVGKTSEVGNCIHMRYEDYERVFIEMNENACYDQWIRVLFKRETCPKPPHVLGLTPEKK